MSQLPDVDSGKRTGTEASHEADVDSASSAFGARYLTDGAHLYRNLGPLDGARELIGLEDCGSLEVLLVCGDELLEGRVRAVDAADAS